MITYMLRVPSRAPVGRVVDYSWWRGRPAARSPAVMMPPCSVAAWLLGRSSSPSPSRARVHEAAAYGGAAS
jgi:hypothetical protein